MLKRLRYFVAVAGEQHFGRAAVKLHMSQSPLSQQVRRLEEEIGVALFKRTTRKVELTEAGRYIFESLQPMLADIDHVLDSARALHSEHLGEIRFGVVATATYSLFPRLLAVLREKFPQATFQLTQLSASALKQAVLDQRIDLGVVRGDTEPAFLSKLIACEPLFVGMPHGHALCETAQVAMQALRGERFVMWDPQGAPGISMQIARLCARHGIAPQVAQLSPQFLVIVSLVAEGYGIAIVPESVAQLGQPGVTFRRLSDADAYSEVSLIWKASSSSRPVERFVEQIDAVERPSLLL